MSKNTITIKGHGLSLAIDAGSFSGLPTFVTCPRPIQKAVEAAYRQLVGRTDGGLSYSWRNSRCAQISENVFERRLPMELSLYHRGSDGVSRRTQATRRIFRVYCRQEFPA